MINISLREHIWKIVAIVALGLAVVGIAADYATPEGGEFTILAADRRLTQLTELTSPVSEDLLYVVDDPSGSPTSKQATLSNVGEGFANIVATGTISAVSNITSETKIYGVGVDAGDADIDNVADIALDTISADDGVSFAISSDWTNAGNAVADMGTITTTNIDGGTIDGAVIGGSSTAAGSFTTIDASGITELDGGLTVDDLAFTVADATGNTVISGTLHVTNMTTIGDGTNEMSVSSTGDVLWTGTGGLAFGEIYAVAANDTTTIITAGIASRVQVTTFDTNGLTNNMTPDHANDHILVTNAGMYLCTISLHIESAGGGGADTFGFSLYKNNGTTEFPNVHAHRQLAGGGGDVGSVGLSGIIDLAENDTIELWTYNEDSTDDLVVQDVTLSLVQIGGT